MSNSLFDVRLFLKTHKLVLHEPLSIGVEVRNIGSEPVRMIGVLDGSETGQRFPHYLPKINGLGSISQVEWSDFTSPLRNKDFVFLQPGESFDPTTSFPIVIFRDFVPTVAGEYSFELVLSTESRSDEDWLGSLPDDEQYSLLPEIAKIPRCTIRSNVLVVNV